MKILTFDIEEWFHILDNESTKTVKKWENFEYRIDSNIDRILELLADKNQKATFFCLGWIALKFPHILKKISSCNYEIGSHSNLHRLVYEQSRKEFKADLRDSINRIEDIIGKKVKSYRAPGFSLINNSKWVFEELLAAGIEIDCSIFPTSRAHGGFLNFPSNKPVIIDIGDREIREFPINTISFASKSFVFSGGGYFRLFPYFLLHPMFKNSKYVMTYFHPRDFDIEQPIIRSLSNIRKFRSYVGINNAFFKLEKLISDFDFVDLTTANNSINWDKTDKIKYQNL